MGESSYVIKREGVILTASKENTSPGLLNDFVYTSSFSIKNLIECRTARQTRTHQHVLKEPVSVNLSKLWQRCKSATSRNEKKKE